MNMSLIIMEGKYGDIDADEYSFYSYYIIKFSSSPYTLQADLISDGQFISSGEMVCEVKIFNQYQFSFFVTKTNPIKQFFSKDNHKWQCQFNMLLF